MSVVSNLVLEKAADGAASVIGPGSKVQIRTGSPSATQAATGTLLGEATLAGGFDASVSGVASYSELPIDVTITTGGTIGHCRVTEVNGTVGAISKIIESSGNVVVIDDIVRISIFEITATEAP